MGLGQTAEEHLLHTRAQVEQHRGDGAGTGVHARPDHRLELLGTVGQFGQHGGDEHAGGYPGGVELLDRPDAREPGAACPARWSATPPRRACRSTG